MLNNLTFVTYQKPNAPTRRIRSRRACSECRYKKRRCNHQPRKSFVGYSHSERGLGFVESPMSNKSRSIGVAGPETEIERTDHEEQHKSPRCQSIQAQQQQNLCQGLEQQQDQAPQHRAEEQQTHSIFGSDTHTSPSTPRFISDLNPEVRFLLGNPDILDDAQEIVPGEVGVWVRPRRCSKCGCSNDPCSHSVPYPPSEMGPGQFRPLVSDLLSHKSIKTLSEVYFNNMHPILPLLDEEEYWQSLSWGTIPLPLVHVVCLLAAKHNGAEKHLTLLQSGDTLIPVREFCSELYMSLSTTLSRRTTMRKITLVRILGLLSLHQEGSDAAEQASSCIAQAMHHAQSLGLHLPRPADVDYDLKRTFWCLWILDRLSSVTNSGPCIMNDIDIAISDLTPEESGFVAFDVCFRITKILNKVIGLYRPNNEDSISGWDSGFPGFEQIVDELQAWQLSSSTIATLHIFYLATAMLTHRLQIISTLLSPTPARLRQQLSAIQVIRYMEDRDRLKALHPFPIVIYAISLAVSVSYQQIRYSRLSSDQEDARLDFVTGSDILQELCRKWRSADAMASLAHRSSSALDQLPCLDTLRSGEPEQMSLFAGNGSFGFPTQDPDDQQSVILPPDNYASDPQITLPCSDTNHLFSGMDDVSWMHLDAENPVSFESFPLMNF